MPQSLNVIPLAIMCAGWIAPVLRFWLRVHTEGVAPRLPWLAAAFAACIAAWWLPRSYDRVRGRRLYELVGVRWFRNFVPDGDLANRWRRRREPGYRVIRNRADAKAFALRYVASERAHLVLLLIGFATCAYAWRIGWNGWAAYLFVMNVLVNLYPMLLQRYTRARIARLA